MVFSSILFMFRFLPIVLLLYFVVPKQIRNTILFIASLIFYAWGEPVYVVLMLFSTVVDYTHGRMVYKCKQKGEMKKARLWVASSMIINLALLGFFKYADFVITNLNLIPGVEIPLLNLALPIGISFYTFQTMSYTVDVYRGDALPQKNIISFGAYVALFPQLIAGPIVAYNTVAEQLEGRKENLDDFATGVMRFMTGVGKKVLLANNIGLLWDMISARGAGEVPVLMAWLGITAYAFQIYFDFSGYSDMAIGLGNIFGFTFPENFNYPYISKNVTEYWRRWHMTLGSWFRDYLFYPVMRSKGISKLAKSLKSGGHKSASRTLPTIIALSVVWFSTGLWHGASWNYVLWGVYYGFWLIVEKFVLEKFYKKHAGLLSEIIQRVSFVFITLFGFAIFYHETNLFTKLGYLLGIGTVAPFDVYAVSMLYENGILLIVAFLCSLPVAKTVMDIIRKKMYATLGENAAYNLDRVIKTVVVLALFVLCTIRLAGDSYNPFIYFKF